MFNKLGVWPARAYIPDIVCIETSGADGWETRQCSCPKARSRLVASRKPNTHRNRLLAALSPGDLALLEPHLTSVALETRDSFEEPNKPIKHIYFMETGFASVVGRGDDGKEIEVGLIGCEGMTGLAVVMGNHQAPHHVYVQARGQAQRIGAAQFRKALGASETLRALLLRFVQTFMVQTAHTAIANGRASIEERLARWVLMARDRIEGDELPLTHEFLSLMLGVRRAGVTVAVKALEKRGLLYAGHGRLRVLNRKGLEEVAGGYYGVPEAELRRLMS
jgi:CRP-like cAMP-binding protein